jgi:hypothetical protein
MIRFVTRREILILWAIVTSAGCGERRFGPPQFVAPVGAEQAPREVLGAWSRIDLVDGGFGEGELIACQHGTLYLRSVRSSGREVFFSVPLSGVRAVHVRGPGETAGVAVWSVLGTLTSGTHGWFFPLSGVAWVLTGSIASGFASGSRMRAPNCDEIRPWVRFPQGMPDDAGWFEQLESGTFAPMGSLIEGGEPIGSRPAAIRVVPSAGGEAELPAMTVPTTIDSVEDSLPPSASDAGAVGDASVPLARDAAVPSDDGR